MMTPTTQRERVGCGRWCYVMPSSNGATQVLGRVAAAGGARPLCHDRSQAQRAADLYVYLAQHHGPQDAVEIGRLGPKWCRMELVADCSQLGTPDPPLWRTDLAAGRVAPLFDDLGDVLNETLLPDDLCLAPWGQVLHHDPDDCGEHVCRAAISTDADVQKYAVWAWLLARPRPGPSDRTSPAESGPGPPPPRSDCS